MNMLGSVIAPVFLVIAFGYGARAFKLFSDDAVEGLMRFAQNFAVPVLLFQSIATLDLGQEFRLALIAPFYLGAFASFALGWVGARKVLGRSAEDSVAIGFVCLFSNSLLLGVPITERAYGAGALTGNYAIISIHSPLLYSFGITVMEFTRARGSAISVPRVAGRALLGVLRTPLVIGIMAGLMANLAQSGGLVIPEPVWAAVRMMAGAALPAALFGLGGVLYRYRPEGDLWAILMCCAGSLILHPALTYGLARAEGLDMDGLRSAVMTAAMAPGINAYLFANMYGAARRVAASAVLIGTAASVATIWMWLHILP